MKKRVISIFCVLLAIMIVFAGCDLLSGGKPNSGGGTSGSSQGSGSGTGGGSGSGGSGSGGSGTGGSGTGGGNGSGGSGNGTGGGNTPPVTPPENPPVTPPGNPEPPAPEVSFDGTWVYTEEIPASSGGFMGDIPAFNIVAQKLVIEGTTAKSYSCTDDYSMSAMFFALIKETTPGFNSPDLLPEFNPAFETGTVSVENGALTVVFPEGSDSISVAAATMAEDGNSFSFTAVDSTGEPVTFTYEKYTPSPLDGVWVSTDHFEGSPDYYQILNKVVFYGNSFQVSGAIIEAYEDAIEAWINDPTAEFPEPGYDFPEFYGTYTANGDEFTLTVDPSLTNGMTFNMPVTIGEGSISIDEGEGITEYVRPESVPAPVRGSGNGGGDPINVDLDGTWFGIVTEPSSSMNDYTGFAAVKLVFNGDDVTMYQATEDCLYDMGNWNFEFSPTYHDEDNKPTTEWGDLETGTYTATASGITLNINGESPVTLTSEDEFETFAGSFFGLGTVSFSQVDPTTLDGYYVMTLTVGEKLLNGSTIIIEGNAIKQYALTYGVNGDGGKRLDDAVQKVVFEGEGTVEGLSLTTSGERPVTYSLLTTESGTYLVDSSSGIPQYEKVLPGKMGKSSYVLERVFKDDLLFDLIIYKGRYVELGAPEGMVMFDGFSKIIEGELGVTHPFDAVSGEMEDQTITVKGISYYITDDVTDDDATITFALDDTTATITVQDWPTEEGAPASPAGTWTRYVRTEPWPVAPAE